ncbi:SMI1/KNR4 family protein [Streptomyces sp. NPDC056983]|uniref:SMI1/KNR4 family protein n=1 Tax=Streptomyces sp. NPDC056983 TaxID=3345987 RepID=UPI0036258716
MDEQELLAAVDSLVRPGGQELVCDQAGHQAGHVCLTVSEEPSLPVLIKELSDRHGQLRNLATGGYVDPTVTEQTGLPLLAPFGKQLVEMRAWACGMWWIGCGTVRAGDGVRLVVLVAERAAPSPDKVPDMVPDGLPEGASWVDRVVAVTGWPADRAQVVNWAAAEARLGTVLPGDYKRLVERFGYGAFDDYLRLFLPGGPLGSIDIVEFNEWWARWTEAHDGHSWEPYQLYPAPGGLLQWAGTEQRDDFYWLTEGPDPDRWPILATVEDRGTWYRFDGSTAEYVYRLLTDPRQPFSTARHFDVHWFESYEGLEAEGD